MACFQSDGMAPSASDLFIKIARGLASALQPSLRSTLGKSTVTEQWHSSHKNALKTVMLCRTNTIVHSFCF